MIGAVFGEWAGADSGLGPPDPRSPPPSCSTALTLRRDRRPLGDARSACSGCCRWWSGASWWDAASEIRARRSETPRMRQRVVGLRLDRSPRPRVAGGRRAAARRRRTGRGEPEQFDLTLDFYVNPDHAGIYTALDRGYFERRRARGRAARPLRPLGADQAGRRGPRRPGDLLRARGAARPRPGPRRGRGRRAGRRAADLADLAAGGGDPRRPDLDGKTVATAGIPYQTDYLETILATAGLTADDVKQVDVGFNLLPALLAGRADAILGGFRNIEGVDLAQRGRRPPRRARGPARGPHLRRARAGRQGRAGRGRPRGDPPVHRRARTGTRDAVADPAAATDAILRATTTSTRS